jgi:hypothetical protein
MNHTPGPWKIKPSEVGTEILIIAPYSEKEKDRYPASEGKWIASTRMYSQEEHIFNARLIASAPDLLEACIKAYESLDAITDFIGRNLEVTGWHLNGDAEPFDNFINENMDGNELEILYKAIQKAKGKDHEKS